MKRASFGDTLRLSPRSEFKGGGFRITTVSRSLIDVASLAPDEDQLARASNGRERATVVGSNCRVRLAGR